MTETPIKKVVETSVSGTWRTATIVQLAVMMALRRLVRAELMPMGVYRCVLADMERNVLKLNAGRDIGKDNAGSPVDADSEGFRQIQKIVQQLFLFDNTKLDKHLENCEKYIRDQLFMMEVEEAINEAINEHGISAEVVGMDDMSEGNAPSSEVVN